MLAWLRKLFCSHPNQDFLRNIYGDEIFHAGGKRSIWKCRDCDKLIYKPELSGAWKPGRQG